MVAETGMESIPSAPLVLFLRRCGGASGQTELAQAAAIRYPVDNPEVHPGNK